MSIEVLGRMQAQPAGGKGVGSQADDEPPSAEGFVRFCHQRSGAEWPRLYDVMCSVAASGGFRGMAYEELAELGISFTLSDSPRMAALSERVVREGVSEGV